MMDTYDGHLGWTLRMDSDTYDGHLGWTLRMDTHTVLILLTYYYTRNTRSVDYKFLESTPETNNRAHFFKIITWK